MILETILDGKKTQVHAYESRYSIEELLKIGYEFEIEKTKYKAIDFLFSEESINHICRSLFARKKDILITISNDSKVDTYRTEISKLSIHYTSNLIFMSENFARAVSIKPEEISVYMEVKTSKFSIEIADEDILIVLEEMI